VNIKIELNTSSINSAIRQLKRVKDNIEDGLKQTIDILVKDGAMTAQSCYGSMANVRGYMTSDHSGVVEASGDAVLIAEFGAGDTTINPLALFENAPSTEVFPGSYSLLVGTKEYATYGSWHFGGREYTSVTPRLGLFNAKQSISGIAGMVAQGVIKL